MIGTQSPYEKSSLVNSNKKPLCLTCAGYKQEACVINHGAHINKTGCLLSINRSDFVHSGQDQVINCFPELSIESAQLNSQDSSQDSIINISRTLVSELIRKKYSRTHEDILTLNGKCYTICRQCPPPSWNPVRVLDCSADRKCQQQSPIIQNLDSDVYVKCWHIDYQGMFYLLTWR